MGIIFLETNKDFFSRVSVSRRALAPSSVTVYVWYAASATSAKCIWSMAIAQHGFFIDRSNKKVSVVSLNFAMKGFYL